MTVTLSRTYRIACAHRLTNLRPGHKCARQHGHNYEIRVEVASSTGGLENGFVMDAEDLDTHFASLVARLDHNELNHALLDGSEFSVACASQPTAENLALYVLSWAGAHLPATVHVTSVSVGENDRLFATARP